MMRQAKEQGSVLVISLIVLLGLMSLGAIAVLSARTESRTGALERGERVALYAAEAGIAAAQEYLRENCSPTAGFNPLGGQALPREIPNNPADKPPLDDPDASYSVTFYQEGSCNGSVGATGACVAVRSLGSGPGGATTLIKVQLTHPCQSAAQTRGIYAGGSGEARVAGAGGVTAIQETGTEDKKVPDAGL